ncbi:SdiA-regulated domain-containing protein [Pelobium manganitolerans]|uniref:SdiA-regulated domain-containing protein n=1 Tax=Pelobium manganitolerans TaxID=1842495 RepID=UPI003FA3C87D
MNKLLLAFLIIACASCKNKKERDERKGPVLDSVSNVIEVPKDLKEISDLTFVNDSLVAAIEDEKGILYFFDLSSKKIVREFVFADDGDYEDLAQKGDTMYVVKANGTIYEIAKFMSEHPQVTYYKTPLKSKHDVEGLAYDAKNNRLLLSVKEKNLDKNHDEKEFKSIYQFTLKDMKFHEEPAIKIYLKDIEAQFKGDELLEASKDFLKAIGNKNLNEVIKPSALAFHPKTGQLYVLSSINKFILVLNADGSFSSVKRFNGAEFIQPEGIAFNAKNELYISNEGRNKKGNIVKLID